MVPGGTFSKGGISEMIVMSTLLILNMPIVTNVIDVSVLWYSIYTDGKYQMNTYIGAGVGKYHQLVIKTEVLPIVAAILISRYCVIRMYCWCMQRVLERIKWIYYSRCRWCFGKSPFACFFLKRKMQVRLNLYLRSIQLSRTLFRTRWNCLIESLRKTDLTRWEFLWSFDGWKR